LEALFDEVDIPSEIREARMAAVKDYQNFTQKGGFGGCDEISEEREVLEMTAKEPKCIVHFMVPEFRRCQVRSNLAVWLLAVGGGCVALQILRPSIFH
jgi:hypothetical protein